jgi:hypothetical protein
MQRQGYLGARIGNLACARQRSSSLRRRGGDLPHGRLISAIAAAFAHCLRRTLQSRYPSVRTVVQSRFADLLAASKASMLFGDAKQSLLDLEINAIDTCPKHSILLFEHERPQFLESGQE